MFAERVEVYWEEMFVKRAEVYWEKIFAKRVVVYLYWEMMLVESGSVLGGDICGESRSILGGDVCEESGSVLGGDVCGASGSVLGGDVCGESGSILVLGDACGERKCTGRKELLGGWPYGSDPCFSMPRGGGDLLGMDIRP